MNSTDRLKTSSWFSDDPSALDYARVGGRTALEGGLGAYGGGALTAILAGLIAKRNMSQGLKDILRATPSIAAGAGGIGSGMHGYQSAMDNMKERLGPVSKAKRLLHL